jgi:hypothetical protein
MNIHKIALLSLFAATLVLAAHLPATAEMRFGPWVYFAPYYFPPDRSCLGYCLTDQDFLPKYQSPNPLPPPKDGFCPPPRRSGRARAAVASSPRGSVSIPVRTAPVEPRSRQLNRPSPDAPRIVPTTPPRPQSRPGAFNRGFGPPSDQYRPRQVGSRPGPSAALPPQY